MRTIKPFILTLAASFAISLLLPGTGSTHEPITTKVMFNKEVIRIFERSCLGCHSPGRIKADIPLTTFEEARPWAKAIKEEILEKRMMPFQAMKGYGSFQHDYILPQREVDLMISWIEGGAPRGVEKDYPQHLRAALSGQSNGDAGWPLGQPDLILQPATQTKIPAKLPANLADETRCFAIPAKLKETRAISGFDFQPGNGAVVHSAAFYIEKTPKAGGACDAVPAASLKPLGVWIPAQPAVQFPKGTAITLPAGSRIIMKIRYKNDGEATTDRSKIALYFSKNPADKPLRTVMISAPKTVVPPNAGAHKIRAAYSISRTTEAAAIRPLLFPYAKSVEVTAYRPDGSIEVLIWAKNYRFDWQPTYYFKKPVELPSGSRIEITAYLDNSEENRNHPGDGSKPLHFSQRLCELSLTGVWE